MNKKIVALWMLLVAVIAPILQAQIRPRVSGSVTRRNALDRQIAAQFAPVFYQGLGDQLRSDYITNFDFDGDWKGDNNWRNTDNKSYPLKAYVYYSVIETTTHYFVAYGTFHPRDYKGGLAKSALLDSIISEGLRRAGKDPTGMADDVALSHENDLEGCLVVAEKRGNDLSKAVVQFVETMAHNRFYKLRAASAKTNMGDVVDLKDQHPLLFSEPKGHGVFKYANDKEQTKKSVNGVLVYSFTGIADEPEKRKGNAVGYDLLPLNETLWSRAQGAENDTFGETAVYEKITVTMQKADGTTASIEQSFGKLGSALRGTVGFKNRARPPWSWYDSLERDRPRGEWFFTPAAVIARHFGLEQNFSQTYLYHPFLKINVAP